MSTTTKVPTCTVRIVNEVLGQEEIFTLPSTPDEAAMDEEESAETYPDPANTGKVPNCRKRPK